MPKRIEHKVGDIIGNNLTYLSDEETIKGRRFIKVQCHCGNSFKGNYVDIKSNKVKSCGCLNHLKKISKFKEGNLVGNNGITFIKDLGTVSVDGKKEALFKCSCGNEFKNQITVIKQDVVISCGCKRGGNNFVPYAYQELIGNSGIKYLYDVEKTSNVRRAKLECHCGNIFENDVANIFHAKVKSCGCTTGIFTSKIEYPKNSVLGSSQIIYKEDTYTTPRGIRYAKFECHCGNEFETMINSVKTGNTTSCGCVKSKPEAELKSFIQSLNIPFKANDRTIIKPKELDLIIPSHKLAIEFNGLFWHSELQGKDRKYHIDKTNSCKESGYELIHIFEHQWKNKQEIVKDIIKKRLGLVENKLFARKCQLREVETNEARTFLEENHLQGYANATYKIGLYYDNELVSIMTFGKSRYDKKVDWELIRFANKLGTNVLGGASKILKYFRTNYKGSLVSYCDISIFSGNLYKQLGFEFSHLAKPNYFYFDSMRNVYSRVSFQKHKLKDKLANFNPTLSEWDNMLNNDFNRYWDCGNAVYILN